MPAGCSSKRSAGGTRSWPPSRAFGTGKFKAWVEANCRCSYSSAREYMLVARRAKMTDVQHFDGGVRAFLEAHAKPRPVEPVQFDVEDAERALRINDRVERGEGAERAVAAWAPTGVRLRFEGCSITLRAATIDR